MNSFKGSTKKKEDFIKRLREKAQTMSILKNEFKGSLKKSNYVTKKSLKKRQIG